MEYSTNPDNSNMVGRRPNPRYPSVSNAKASSMEFLNPILSASAPANVENRYKQAENTPAMPAACRSLKPKIRLRYKVITIKFVY